MTLILINDSFYDFVYAFNAPPFEQLFVAAGEQGKITVLRFHKLLITLSSTNHESEQSKL